ncbi:MAG: ABC transporter permease [Dehalococcoidia bacterium]
MSWLDYIGQHIGDLLALMGEHLYIVGVSLLAALIIGIAVGIFISRHDRLASVVLSIASAIMTIPSLAMFAFMIPLLGIGLKPAWTALTLYALLPIIRNTYVAVRNVSPAMLEAGMGMGMTDLQILARVRIPLALPVIMAGIRTSVVLIIGIAAIAAYIGAGGLGTYIFQGIGQSYGNPIIAGALAVSVLAIASDIILGRLESWLVPKGLKVEE